MSSFEEESIIYFKDVYNACQVDMPELENTLKDEDKDQDKDKDKGKGSIWVTSHSRSEPHCRVDTGCQMRLQKKSPWQQPLLSQRHSGHFQEEWSPWFWEVAVAHQNL